MLISKIFYGRFRMKERIGRGDELYVAHYVMPKNDEREVTAERVAAGEARDVRPSPRPERTTLTYPNL